ncbi:unnamed protein product [Prorocentrum cordatum]|uniref:Uncharacterized protein n=1 Tax=Prorocentrum cordatum TaxID=2364126 RepID=A0ABN9YCC5_9DINO|nr:unnamed protein product [Polarella glacialis]
MLQVEVRHLTLDKTRGEAKFKRLSEEFSKLSAEAKESEYKFASCRAKLQQKDVETIQMADLRAQLDRLKKNAILDGLDFAERIAREVFCKPTLEEACGEAAPNMPVAPKMPATNANVQRARVLLDVMVGILKGMRTEIQDHLRRIRELNQQLGGMRQLVPPWNLELAQDLENFYDVDAPIHRQIFSMKDQRSFAGLGTGEDVPKYLRAEGFVKHVFVSAATCQEFMSSFFRHFFSVEERPVRKSILDMSGREVQDLSTEAFHEELHIYLKQRFGGDGQAVTEFAYAFICSLEANRDDPDFELFDLILRGAVHPSIVKDEEELLRWLRTLLEDCQERYDPFNAAAEGSASGNRELVTRRTIAAVLKAIFPDKSPAQMDELRRATHATVEQLVAAAKAVGPDRVHVSDLFAQTADGTQSALIEEIRRQHYREVVRFAARMARQLSDRAQRKAAQAGDDGPLTVDSDTLRKVLQGLDATISRPPELDEAVRRVFPLAGQAGDQPQDDGSAPSCAPCAATRCCAPRACGCAARGRATSRACCWRPQRSWRAPRHGRAPPRAPRRPSRGARR